MNITTNNVVQFPVPEKEIKVATCGCGGQEFGLVADEEGLPEFVYCYSCQHKLLGVRWWWIP